jgi:hypothetical protein
MMIATTHSRTFPVKRLITAQGVLTLLGLVTGVAAIFLPVGSINAKPYFYTDISVPVLLGYLVDLGSDNLVPLFLLVGLPDFVLLLAVPISIGYFRWLLTGGLAPWAWRSGYALAALAGLVVLSLGSLVFLLEGVDLVTELGVAAMVLVPLGVGAWWVIRNRRGGLPHALNALVALQIVYVADAALLLLVFLVEDVEYLGAWFALLTGILYVAQIVLGSLRERAIEHSARPTTKQAHR